MKGKIGLVFAALAAVIAVSFTVARAQDAGDDDAQAVSAVPAAPTQTVNAQQPAPPTGWDRVLNAVQDLLLGVIGLAVFAVGAAAWWVRGIFARKLAAVRNDTVQTMKASAMNVQTDMLATLLREQAKQAPPSRAAELEAKAVEGSKVVILPPGGLP